MDIDKRARDNLGNKSFALIGLMGAGKTTIGRMISSRIKIPFVDTDHEIEKLSSMTVKDFFLFYGEDVFRDLELQVAKMYLQGSRCILSTGGGLFLNEKIREYIQSRGITLWLQASCDVLWSRIENSGNHPLLDGENPKEILRSLMESRYSIYAQADMVLCSSDLSIEETTDNVIRKLADFDNY
ncbi:MAG: shikimate kinase [Candidatus Liberibacter europaeus]|uniref:Shikimate kinase n=1 Tax=Candidatus Liberibacter europaeus TaxID=744859 RepID=A0A2T4VYE1_9HYPH|nr:shikimate kinase [Candidatus Liberibacter europaeus]PTL86798.1 MAG: shikimate kinase [Candidatus Liberibacter europaeus]